MTKDKIQNLAKERENIELKSSLSLIKEICTKQVKGQLIENWGSWLKKGLLEKVEAVLSFIMDWRANGELMDSIEWNKGIQRWLKGGDNLSPPSSPKAEPFKRWLVLERKSGKKVLTRENYLKETLNGT